MAELLKPRIEEMIMKINRKLLGAVALFAMFSAFNANAQSSQNINVTAQVQPTCVINGGGSALDFDFGVIDTASGADVAQSANFTWRCTSGLAVEIELDAGDNVGSVPAAARLLEAGAGNFLQYLLCHDVTCTQPWGDGTTAPDLVTAGSGMGVPVTQTIFGVLDGTFAQSAVPGSYQETVVLSLNF
jgi:spore coat protein U-like protein